MPPFAALHFAARDIWPLLLVPVAAVLAAFAYRQTTPPLDRRRRVPLVALRTLAYALLFLVLASPVLNRERREAQRARIAVLVDESASMGSADLRGGATRLDRARRALVSLREALRGADVDLEVVPFAAEPGPALAPDAYVAKPAAAEGAGTDVLRALDATCDRLAAENLQALVLLSDGRPTQGGIDASAAAGLGRPVFALGFGDTLPPRDLAIGRCDYSPIAYVESQTEIDVRVENVGYRGRGTTLRLLQADRELYRRQLEFDQDQGRTSVRIPVELSTPGRQRLRLVLDALPEEFTERNNGREIGIEVLKSKLRVLLLAARPDWDVAFLARTLRDDPNVRLTAAHRDASGAWIASDEGRRFTLPQGAGWARDFDLYVLASADGLQAEARDLAVAVERGKGLLVLAASGSVDALSPMLPVAVERQRTLRYGTAAPRFAPQGRSHPATASLLDLADPAGELAALPPILVQRGGLVPRPGALVLLATEADPDLPLLVVGRHGEGQTAVLNGSPLWRWGLSDREPVRRACIGFVGGLVRWLTQPRDVRPVQVTTPKSVYESGESAEFLAQVIDAQYSPVDDAEVRLEVRRSQDGAAAPATLVLRPRAGHAGEYVAALPGLGPGEYEATVTATRAGRGLGVATTRFTVDAYSPEFASTAQDIEFLREVAAQSGGRYGTEAQTEELARALPRTAREVVLRSEVEVWDTAPLFLLFVAALGAEWLLRKRQGLL